MIELEEYEGGGGVSTSTFTQFTFPLSALTFCRLKVNFIAKRQHSGQRDECATNLNIIWARLQCHASSHE